MSGDSSDSEHEELKRSMLREQMSVYGNASVAQLFGPSKGRRAARDHGRKRGNRGGGAGARNWSQLPQYKAEKERLRLLASQGELDDDALAKALGEEPEGEDNKNDSLLDEPAATIALNPIITAAPEIGAEVNGVRRRKRSSGASHGGTKGELEVAEVLDELGLRAEERAILWRVFLPLSALAGLSLFVLLLRQPPSTISKVLGWMIIVGTFAVKGPQIQSVYDSKSAEGLEMSRFYSESVSLAMVVAYHVSQKHPFTSWGDNLTLMVLNTILISLLWQYMNLPHSVTSLYTGAYVVIIGASFGAAFGLEGGTAGVIPLVSTIISQAGLIPQLVANERNQHTGSLSLISQALSTLGTAVRIFTTLMEISDIVVLGSFVTGFLLNFYLLYQIIRYRENTARVMERMKLIRNAQEAIPVLEPVSED